MAALAAGGPRARGRDISLAALQRHDPYISGIVDVASQVALYTFGHRANEWEKTDVEGTLFVYTRSASPEYGFTIMNRLSMENRTEPITKDLDLQLQDPFLLYRNARLSIYGIWFYDKEECQRIAELMKNLTQSAQLRAGAGGPPAALGAGEAQEADILQILTKARDEYARWKTCSEPKPIACASSIRANPNLIKPVPVKPRDGRQHSQAPDPAGTPELQHLSVTALFAKQGRAHCPRGADPSQPQAKPPGRQGAGCSLTSQEPPEEKLCPAVQKLMVSAELHPRAEAPERRPCTARAPGPVPPSSPHHTPRTSRAPSLLETLQGTPGAAAVGPGEPSTPAPPSPTALPTATHTAPGQVPARSHPGCASHPLTPPPGGHAVQEPGQPAPGSPAPTPGCPPGALPPRELLRKLQAAQRELQAAQRPGLAARFPVLSPGPPVEAWASHVRSSEKPASLLQRSGALQYCPGKGQLLGAVGGGGGLQVRPQLETKESTCRGHPPPVTLTGNPRPQWAPVPRRPYLACLLFLPVLTNVGGHVRKAWVGPTLGHSPGGATRLPGPGSFRPKKHRNRAESAVLQTSPAQGGHGLHPVPLRAVGVVSCGTPEPRLSVCCVQAISPQCMSGAAASSLLLSPTAFTHAPASDREGCPEPPAHQLPLQGPEHPSVGAAAGPLSRQQLQEALLYLVQNDDSFLNMVYEAYLFSMAQTTARRAT
ncbi:mRNA-decapping enzyme 1B [Thomomys bottae]